MTRKEDKLFKALLWGGVAFVVANIALTIKGISPYQIFLG